MTKSNLFKPNVSYKPFLYPNLVEQARLSEQMHWIEDELNLQDDVNQWTGISADKLTTEEKNHIHQILKLFTQSDVVVGTNYINYLLPVFKNNEVRAMLTSFCAREFIHQRGYAILNDTLGLPESDYFAFLEYEQMAEKVEFMSANSITDNTGMISVENVLLTIVKSILNEGVSLFSAFAMLLNYSRFGKMKGMSEVVEWSVKDENCLEKGTLIFSDHVGWIPIEEVRVGHKIFQFDISTGLSSFVPVLHTTQTESSVSYTFESDAVHQTVTPNHRMIFTVSGQISGCLAKDFENSLSDKVFIETVQTAGSRVSLTDEERIRCIDCARNSLSLDWVELIKDTITPLWAQEFLALYRAHQQ